MGANKHAKHMEGQANMLSNKRLCPRRKNVGLDRVCIVPLCWSMDNTRVPSSKVPEGTRGPMYQRHV